MADRNNNEQKMDQFVLFFDEIFEWLIEGTHISKNKIHTPCQISLSARFFVETLTYKYISMHAMQANADQCSHAKPEDTK